jgi:hypothetical protein
MALRNVDQFALLGIRPTTKLSFEELLKQAIRVAVLLHPDKVPPNVDPPFTSATANDLKSWLQLNGTSEADHLRSDVISECVSHWQREKPQVDFVDMCLRLNDVVIANDTHQFPYICRTRCRQS